MMPLIDSHCHLDFACFDSDRAQLLNQCQQQGIQHLVVPAVSRQRWSTLISLCQQYPMLKPALGLHPMFMDDHHTSDLVALEAALNTSRPIAVGEIGLDFYLPEHNKPKQLALFSEQIKLAQQFDLPVILHVRKAHDEVLKILRQHRLTGGIVHAFNGSLQQAEAYMKLGFIFGIGGALTYERSTKLRHLFSTLPLDHIVLETDSPDMPLAQQSEQRNTPLNLPIILHTLAKLRHTTTDHIAEKTTANCQRVLGLC